MTDGLAAAQTGERAHEAPGPSYLAEPVEFNAVAGWRDDDHVAAFRAFRVGASSILAEPPKTRGFGITGESLQPSARAALACVPDPGPDGARTFFEKWFVPRRVAALGFVTGYYEPEVEARLRPDALFRYPLHRRPADLVDVRPETAPPGWDPEMRFARRAGDKLVPHVTRAEVDGGALDGRGLELAWLASPVDAFFIHVQGSARLRLPGGRVMRIGFDGKSGHPYTSIGRVAVEEDLLARENADKDGLEAWLRANHEAGLKLMRRNLSYIFFRETGGLAPDDGPIGAAGVPLTPGRSLAVDRTHATFHVPVWVDAPTLPDGRRPGAFFRRLLVAQDTGSAIVGPARGDIFFGSGTEAGSRAGKVRHAAEMMVLQPRTAESVQ